MSHSLKEMNAHGTPMFPLQVYTHRDINGFYSVTAHWHDELEFLYIEEGTLHGIIAGTPYEMQAGEFYFINSGELHELWAHNHSLHHAIVFDPKFLNFDVYDACQHKFIQPVTQQKLLFPNRISAAISPKEHEELRRSYFDIIQNYHHSGQCALLNIKISLLQILELCFRTEIMKQNDTTVKQLASIVSAKYSCGFSNTLISSIIVDERYLDYFTTITEDRLWQLLAKPVFRWRNRSGLSMNAAKAV